MATSKINKSGVIKTNAVKNAYLGAFQNTTNPSLSQLIQIGVESDMGSYMLMVLDSGITLYDVTNGQVVHNVGWTT